MSKSYFMKKSGLVIGFIVLGYFSYGQMFDASWFGLFIYRYDDAYSYHSLNSAEIIQKHSIKRENIYKCELKKHKIIDSIIFEYVFYDDQGRISEIDYLNKDGKSADRIEEMAYSDRKVIRIQSKSNTTTEGMDYHFNDDGTLRYLYKYTILASNPGDTVHTSLITRTYDPINRIAVDSIKTTKVETRFQNKWQFDDPGYTSFRTMPEGGNGTYGRFDSVLNRFSLATNKLNGGEMVMLEKYFNANHQCVKDIRYIHDRYSFTTDAVQTTYNYNPDKTIYEVQVESKSTGSSLFRHYYFTDPALQ